jgi:hypothetical protein
MALSADQQRFLEGHPAAAMITTTPGGVAKVARVAVTPMDGKVWSSGTQSRVRTRRLRRDPRCTLFVFDPGFAWLALETTVTILEGPEAPTQNVALFRRMQGRQNGPLSWFGRDLDEEQFLQAMVEEGRLVYEFDVHRAYGLQ